MITTSNETELLMSKLKSTDVLMSELTMQQQREIKAADNISIAAARTKILADGVAAKHRRLFGGKK
jgi:hypothetical protein